MTRILLGLFLLASIADVAAAQPVRRTEERVLMGSRFRIVVEHVDTAVAARATARPPSTGIT